ncbi:MAG: YheC/YheD family protein [Desulfitobacteriaceae bacterium]
MTETFDYERENLQPKIGVFLSKQKWKGLVSQHYNPGLAELVRAADVLGLSPVWFSSPQEWLDQGILLAATLKNGVLQIGQQTMPKVVYDLGVFNETERTEGRKIRAALAKQQVKFVNSCSAFSKWTTHVTLSLDSHILPHLPQTVCYRRIADLSDMLVKYQKVCVKSFWGSRGKEVLFVEKTDQDLTLLFPNGIVKRFGNLKDLAEAIYRFMGNKEYIVQQCIELAAWNNRYFDIRVLFQKISRQRWDCTALCLRLALPGHGSTSTSQGSEVREIEPLLREFWPTRYLDIITEIKQLALNIADTLENKYGPLGELGIDVGIDINGGVWIFEVNGKPGKVSVRRLKQNKLIQLAYQRPLLYAKMLLEEN